MRLYYLTSEHWARVILKERRLKLSNVAELNDPFELLGPSIVDKDVRRIVNFVHKSLSEKFGIICMTETWQNPVMWAHYGDKHKGVCLGFNVEAAAAKEVLYTPNRLTAFLSSTPTLKDIKVEDIHTLFTTKYEDWSYERERRVIQNLSDGNKDSRSSLHFLPFNDEAFALREVILGHRCEWTTADAAKAVGRMKHIVDIKKVRPSFHRFEMVRQQRTPVITVKPI